MSESGEHIEVSLSPGQGPCQCCDREMTLLLVGLIEKKLVRACRQCKRRAISFLAGMKRKPNHLYCESCGADLGNPDNTVTRRSACTRLVEGQRFVTLCFPCAYPREEQAAGRRPETAGKEKRT